MEITALTVVDKSIAAVLLFSHNGQRVQRTIDSLLDEAEQAVSRSDWAAVQDRARNVLAFDPNNFRGSHQGKASKPVPCSYTFEGPGGFDG